MKSHKITLYLASRSPRRRELVRALGVPVHIVRSRYREHAAGNLPVQPRALALEHAAQKARMAVLPRHGREHALVLGADTIVVCKGSVLGKPRNRKDAIRMLELLSGRTHEVISAIALFRPSSGRLITGAARTKVTFKNLDRGAILRYVAAVNPLDKAGAYAIQEGPQIVKKIAGSRTNVVGLPMELLRNKLRRALRGTNII